MPFDVQSDKSHSDSFSGWSGSEYEMLSDDRIELCRTPSAGRITPSRRNRSATVLPTPKITRKFQFFKPGQQFTAGLGGQLN